jgi:nicotinamidase-related amidase
MAETSLTLEPKTTALLLLDLQKGIVGMPTQPRSGQDVVANAAKLTERFRALGGLIVHVHVAFSEDGQDALKPPTDAPPMGGQRPPDWADFMAETAPKSGEIVITKRQWGAFYGTELDLQLRRRGIQTLVLTGIATNFVVESTGRDAYERGYAQVFVEDAMTSVSAEAHQTSVSFLFPRLGRVRSTEDVLAALA